MRYDGARTLRFALQIDRYVDVPGRCPRSDLAQRLGTPEWRSPRYGQFPPCLHRVAGEGSSTKVSERVSLLPSPRYPGAHGLHNVETHLKLARVDTPSDKSQCRGRQCSHTERNDRRLRTTVSKPRATGPSPGFHKYCLTSHRSLLAPRLRAYVLYLSFLTAGRFRLDSRLALNRLRSLVQQPSAFTLASMNT